MIKVKVINLKGWSLLFYQLVERRRNMANKKSIPELRKSIEEAEKKKGV
ncbi:hypothetical protein [Ligilactobacillus ruminis]|nr:hypothetical protein [Ligilactobacillus ruminis]